MYYTSIEEMQKNTVQKLLSIVYATCILSSDVEQSAIRKSVIRSEMWGTVTLMEESNTVVARGQSDCQPAVSTSIV